MSLLKVYIDADVLFRAATASHNQTAPLVLLSLAEFTLIDLVTAQYTLGEVLNNLQRFLPAQIPTLLQLCSRAVRIVDDPPSSLLQQLQSQAHWKAVINLAAAVSTDAHLLITFNERDYRPVDQRLQVMTPGRFVGITRSLLYRHWQ